MSGYLKISDFTFELRNLDREYDIIIVIVCTVFVGSMIAHICNVVFNICIHGHRYVRYVYTYNWVYIDSTVILSTKCNLDLAHVMPRFIYYAL